MIISGRRVGWFMANVVAAVLLIWSVVDIVAKTTTSPATMLAQIAFWPIQFRPIAFVGIALAVCRRRRGVLDRSAACRSRLRYDAPGWCRNCGSP